MICDELQLVETCSKHLQYKLRRDGATPAGIACVLRLQAQAMPAESVATPNTQYYCHKKLNFYVATLSS